jgi:hypothetical protein
MKYSTKDARDISNLFQLRHPMVPWQRRRRADGAFYSSSLRKMQSSVQSQHKFLIAIVAFERSRRRFYPAEVVEDDQVKGFFCPVRRIEFVIVKEK